MTRLRKRAIVISDRLRDEFSSLLHDHVRNLKIDGVKATGHVPWRDDEHPSLTADLEKAIWYDQARNEGGGVKKFKERVGANEAEPPARKIVASYDYTDESKTLLFQVVRYELKDFRQRRPDGNGGWLWNLDGTRRVLYRLNSLLMAETVYIVEGEKDADRLWSLGIPATTNPGGAGKWRDEYSESLRGKRVVIIPDHDDVGENHAQAVARSLLLVAKAVKIVRLPDLPTKGDVSDWLDADHSKEELFTLVKATQVLKAEDFAPSPPEESSKNLWMLAKPAPTFLVEEEKEFTGLAKDMIVPGAITLIAAPRGVGKTQSAHPLAVALATGGVFRDEQVKPVRVLLLDRDNPESLVKKRLRSWGATEAHNLHVLTRQDAPDLKNKDAWASFPVDSYDVLVVDSVGASTEGVTEKEGKQTTEILATILDLARKGLAILLLTNTTKDALNLRGRGEWSDRVDIIYEVRDATGFTPSGKKAWWQELPEAGEAAWADRAARRKGKIDFRLAFIASKFRLGVEPEPFCLELHLPPDEPWTLRDVTAEVLKVGEDALTQGKRTKEEQTQKAIAALAMLVSEREAQGNPLAKSEAESFLTDVRGLKRDDARQILKEENPCWRYKNYGTGEGRGARWCLHTKETATGDSPKDPPKIRSGEGTGVAVQSGSGRRLHPSENTSIHTVYSDTKRVAEEMREENESDSNNDFHDADREFIDREVF